MITMSIRYGGAESARSDASGLLSKGAWMTRNVIGVAAAIVNTATLHLKMNARERQVGVIEILLAFRY